MVNWTMRGGPKGNYKQDTIGGSEVGSAKEEASLRGLAGKVKEEEGKRRVRTTKG